MRFNKKLLTNFVLAPVFLSQFIFSDLGTFATPDKFSQPILPGHSAGQTFISDFDGLTKIGIFIDREDMACKGKLVFHLKSSISSKTDIVTAEINVSDIYDNWKEFRFPPKSDKKSCLYFFQFEPIPDSGGKHFYFYLEYQSEDKGRGVRFGITENKYDQGYSGGSSYIDGKEQEWHLLFQTYCAWTGTGKDAFRVILKRISMDRQFFTFYLVLCLALFAALIWITIFKNRRKEG